jgi:hypothetical protein
MAQKPKPAGRKAAGRTPPDDPLDPRWISVAAAKRRRQIANRRRKGQRRFNFGQK